MFKRGFDFQKKDCLFISFLLILEQKYHSMLKHIPIQNILFLDIETVPQQKTFAELSPEIQELWVSKSKYIRSKEEQTAEELYERAGIYAEFGKIICISAGFVNLRNNQKTLRIKSFYGDDEQQLLKAFNQMLNNSFTGKNHYLCAHNGKEFDFPYIARRSLINSIPIPDSLNLAGKKPWEVQHLDTMELWKFGDFKSYTSLETLTTIFNIPTPKDDIKGSDVARVYWEDNDLKRIVCYCQKDVVAIVQLFLRYRLENLIPDDNIIIAE